MRWVRLNDRGSYNWEGWEVKERVRGETQEWARRESRAGGNRSAGRPVGSRLEKGLAVIVFAWRGGFVGQCQADRWAARGASA